MPRVTESHSRYQNQIRSISCQVAESQCAYVTVVKTSRQKPNCQCDYVIEIKPSLRFNLAHFLNITEMT